MLHENYNRLLKNKLHTQETIQSYLTNEQEINNDSRKQELKENLVNAELNPDLILILEELRDLELGIRWVQKGPKSDGSYDLIRDCKSQEKNVLNQEKAEQISYVIQSTNLLLGAKKVLELEEKNTDAINKLLHEQLQKLNSPEKVKIKEFNSKIISFLKTQGVSDIKLKLSAAKDFISMDNRQFHISTITEQKDSRGESKLVIESDYMLLGLTDTQKVEYNKIKDWTSGVLNIDWFDELSDFDKKLVKSYSAKIAEGSVMLPTQTREKLAGLRNAYEKSVFICDMNGENVEQVLEILHTGTPSFHGKGDKTKQTKQNLEQLDSFVPDGVEITDNALNLPKIADGIPNFVNKIDREAPNLIVEAQKIRGTGSCAITPFNGMRRYAANENHGFDKNLLKLGVDLENQDKQYKDIANYLINGTNKENGLKQLAELKNSNYDLYNALKNAINAKAMIINPHSMFENENQNLDLVTAMTLVDFACNNNRGSIKQLLPKINVGKVNIHCASGKDRTGISITDSTNKAISEKLGLNQKQAKENLQIQIKGGHTQELASLNGGTPGCHGVKSDSKTALSNQSFLNKLINKTASYNKIKTKKNFGDHLKNSLKKSAISAAIIVTFPLILATAIITAVCYASYFGAKKLSEYSPNQDDLKKINNMHQNERIIGKDFSDNPQISQQPNVAHIGKHAQRILGEREGSIEDKGRGA